MSEDNFTEDIRVRVPRSVKAAFDRLGAARCKKESELAREAFMLYLERESKAESDKALQLNDAPSSAGQVAAADVVGAAVAAARGGRARKPSVIRPVKYSIPRRSKP